jgi:ribonucleoside-diphosphate reductase alpha chain
MNLPQQVLSDITIHSKYAKFLPEYLRRETWDEIVTRNKEMHQQKFPELYSEIEDAYKLVYDKKVLPSMRSLQFAGKPIELNNARIFNCSYAPVDDYRVFSEFMFLLLSGCGVGFSVQKHHVDKLPEIRIPTKQRRFLVGDSIEGWADAIRMLCKAYFGYTNALPIFDFRDIRPKGARLITSGGKAPGAEPLKECLFQVQKIFDRKKNGDRITSIEAHDIICHLADAVLSGGIRRAALISLFDFDDQDMLTCKFGEWWAENPQRGRANNSAVILRHKITEEEFFNLWEKIEASNSGEPGFLFSNDKDFGTNPCAEIALRPYQFCNLCEINASDIESQEDLDNRARVAAFIGTLQASYTDFHYLRDIWKRTTERDALLGVGMTGIASGEVVKYDLKQAAKAAKDENERLAIVIGINKAARVTTVKPSGTSSLVLGCSSGIHAWHDQYYIRRMRLGKNEALYKYLIENYPDLVEDEFFKPQIQSVVSIPQEAPKNAILRSESAIELLERVKRFNLEWIKAGHRSGANINNVSCTITIKPNEWPEVGRWMWRNRNFYSALSVLPADLGTYKQAPFETITKEQYDEMASHLHSLDMTKVIEEVDETNLMDQAACQGGSCEIV